MKSLLLLATVALVVACGRPQKAKMTIGAKPVEVPRVKTYHQILDDDTGKRVGFIEKVEYDTGRVVYWVLGPERHLKHGYFLPNGSAYRFDYVAGRRSETPENLGADVYSASARRVLGYGRPVRLEAITLNALLAEQMAQQSTDTKPKAEDSGDE